MRCWCGDAFYIETCVQLDNSMLLRTAPFAFTQDTSYAHMFLHREVCAERKFLHRRFCTFSCRTILDTGTCTHRCFTQNCFCTAQSVGVCIEFLGLASDVRSHIGSVTTCFIIRAIGPWHWCGGFFFYNKCACLLFQHLDATLSLDCFLAMHANTVVFAWNLHRNFANAKARNSPNLGGTTADKYERQIGKRSKFGNRMLGFFFGKGWCYPSAASWTTWAAIGYGWTVRTPGTFEGKQGHWGTRLCGQTRSWILKQFQTSFAHINRWQKAYETFGLYMVHFCWNCTCPAMYWHLILGFACLVIWVQCCLL